MFDNLKKNLLAVICIALHKTFYFIEIYLALVKEKPENIKLIQFYNLTYKSKSYNSYEIDLFVVPSVAVGSSGKRLGYGGGFYDKALSSIDKKRICSIIYDFQLIYGFNGEKHDIQVSKVFTDKGFLHIN